LDCQGVSLSSDHEQKLQIKCKKAAVRDFIAQSKGIPLLDIQITFPDPFEFSECFEDAQDCELVFLIFSRPDWSGVFRILERLSEAE
jgi:hypothetical protein